MNVLFLLHLPPPIHGSSMVGMYIYESSLINASFICRHVNILASEKLAQTGKLSLSKIFGFSRIVLKILYELIFKKPDICHFALTISGFAFFRDVILVALLKIFRIKRIYHLHNKGVSLRENNWLYNVCYKYVFKNSDVILLSDYLYPDIERYVVKSNVHICPNGIPDEKEINLERKPVNNLVPKILFFSNLIKSKGVFVLLESCAILKKKGILFECDFIGGEGDITKEGFQQMVDHFKLNSCVRYLGRKYGKEKEDAFIHADIFSFPTFYPNECFPLVIIEAMQYILPIISTEEGGIRDLVEDGETGFLIQKQNANVLADKLEILIDNPDLRQEMGEAGYQKYKNEYTLDIFEKRVVNIIQKVNGERA